jgi:hypothetical protein
MFEFFFGYSMIQNVLSELFGIVVTVIFVDTLYEYRQKQQGISYVRILITEIRKILDDAVHTAFGPLFGQDFLDLEMIQYPIHANNFVLVVRTLRNQNEKVEQYIERYSLLATPQLISLIHKNVNAIHKKLDELCTLYAWQVDNGPLKNDQSIQKAVFEGTREMTFQDILDSMTVVLEQPTIKKNYQELQQLYYSLLDALDQESTKKISFISVLLHDSLMSELFQRLKRLAAIHKFTELRCVKQRFFTIGRIGGSMSWKSENPWTISMAKLQQHAEDRAKGFRVAALLLAGLTLLAVVFVAAFALSSRAYSNVDVTWAIARLSALVLLVALLLLASRIAWNYSNVWLGRAGTLEDLILALRLIGKCPADTELTGCDGKVSTLLSEPLSKDASDNLHVVVQSIERLRRSFEGKLLEGPKSPSIEILSGKSSSGSA